MVYSFNSCFWARSSGGERLTHIQEVAGSKPAAPTKQDQPYQLWLVLFYKEIRLKARNHGLLRLPLAWPPANWYNRQKRTRGIWMEIRELVQQQRRFFASGATKPLAFRLEALQRLNIAMGKWETDILAALQADLHKPPFEGYMTEIGMVREELRFCQRHLARWMRPQRVKTPIAQFAATSFRIAEPYGLALILAPWNYPLQLCLSPLVGAIAAGNCVVLKPSAYAPHTSRVLAALLGEIFDPAYVAVVEGGRAENSALLAERFDYIFFTGSVAVGKVVMAAAAQNLTPVTLELGGKSPSIVTKSADLRLAARRLAFGKCLNAGQTCVAPDYLLIDEAVKEPFLALLEEEIAKFYPQGYADMPSIINAKHFARLTQLLTGARIRFGGQTDAERRWIAPTVVDEIAPGHPLMQEEIFGPILPVLSFQRLEEAVAFIQDRPKPLALYLFSNDQDEHACVLRDCSFGGGCINDTIIHLATTHMPFGGVGESGMGAYHGQASFDTFSHYKSMVKKANWLDLPLRYPPYSEKKFRLLRKFMK